MSLWSCQVLSCPRQSMVFWGDCMTCGDHFCGDHYHDKNAHQCSDPDKPKGHQGQTVHMALRKHNIVMRNRLDLDLIKIEAEILRPGYTCTLPPKKELLGRQYLTFHHGYNFYILLTWNDDTKWVVRVRKEGFHHPHREANYVNLMSEAACLRVLHDAAIDVPQIWLPRNRHAGDFFFIDFIEGEWHNPLNKDSELTPNPSDLTKTIIHNVAKWYITLERVAFSACGRPAFDEEGQIVVGPSITRAPLLDTPPYYLGPFNTARERYIAHFERVLELIKQDRWNRGEGRVRAYLEHLEAKALVEDDEDLKADTGPYYLSHGEPKGDQVIVSEDGDITGVIDWEWSFITSKAAAFAAPWGFAPGSFLTDGDNALGQYEIMVRDAYIDLGRPDLAAYVTNGEKYQRLDDMVELRPKDVFNLNALRRAFGKPPMNGVTESTSTKEWIAHAKEYYHDDQGWKIVEEEERRRIAH